MVDVSARGSVESDSSSILSIITPLREHYPFMLKQSTQEAERKLI
jgi:hypothetical protein